MLRLGDVTNLVLLDDLAEGDDLGMGEAEKRLDLVAHLEQLAVVLGNPPLPLQYLFRCGVVGALGDPSVDGT